MALSSAHTLNYLRREKTKQPGNEAMATLGSREPFVTIRTMRVSGYGEFEHSGGSWLQILELRQCMCIYCSGR